MSDSQSLQAIDVHAHVVPENFDRFREIDPDHAPTMSDMDRGKYVQLAHGRGSGPLPPGMFDLDDRLADMDRMLVWQQAISSPPFMFLYELPPELGDQYIRYCNDSMIATAARAPERICALPGLPMQDPDLAVAEMKRVAADPHVRGIAIGSAVGDNNLDDESYEPIWQTAADLDLGILVHPVDAAGKERMTRYYLRNFVGNPLDSTLAMASLIFSGVLERHPSLRFCFLHGGGFGPYQIGRWEHGWELRPEARTVISRSPREYFDKLYFDSLTHDRLSLEFLVQRSGPDKVVVGSDYMFDMADADPVQHVLDLGLDEDVQRAVLTDNAVSFLRPAS